MQEGFGGVNVTSSAEAGQQVEKLAAAGVDLIKAHSGLTRDDYKAIVDAANKHRIRVHAHVYAETDVRNALEMGVHVLQHVGSAGTAPPYSKELITDIVNAGRPVVVTAAHRAWVYEATAEFPGAAAGSGAEEGVRPRDLRRGAELAEELAVARLLPAHRPRDAVPRARRQAVHRVGRRDGHGHRLGHADELPQRGAVARDQGARGHGHDADARDRGGDARQRADHRQGRELGSIEPGKLADIIVVNGNPLFDIMALSHVEVVVKDGTVYKGGPA